MRPSAIFSSLAQVRRRVRAELHTRGYELAKRPQVASVMYPAMHHVAGLIEPRTVIDVGVAWGTPGLLRAFPRAHFLLVEPLAEFESALAAICARFDASYVLAAAGREPGSLDLEVAPDLSSSSPLGGGGGAVRRVPVVTLDGLVSERKLRGPYVIKVDVQGAELEVLAGAREVLRDTEVVTLETTMFELWPGAPQFEETIATMSELGFVLYDLFGGDRRPLDGAMAQIDLVFAAREGALRANHRYRAAP